MAGNGEDGKEKSGLLKARIVGGGKSLFWRAVSKENGEMRRARMGLSRSFQNRSFCVVSKTGLMIRDGW